MTATPERPFSVLITDDDAGCREVMRDIIEPAGYHTLLATTGEEAVEIVTQQQVHIVLMDVHLPRISGIDALKLLHQMQQQLPCILMTADSTAELIRQAFQAHAYSVIPKPVNKHVVLHMVVRALVKAYGPGPGQAGAQQKAS